MEYWKILTVAENTDEKDFRSFCANKLRGPYVIITRDPHCIAVLLDKDIDVVLSAFDVTDRKINSSVYQGNTLVTAASAWHDYLKSGRL